MTRLRLPPRGTLPRTGPVDSVAQYYQPMIGWVLRQRLRWVLDALPGGPLRRILEVGYGSGILQPSLAERCTMSIGVDPHPYAAQVRRALAATGVPAVLLQADAADIPLASGSFDAVIVVSALEFVPDPERCLYECRRVLRPGGRLLGITPRRLPWADAVYSAISGVRPEPEFQGGRERVQDALARLRPPLRRLRRPAWLPGSLAPYELLIWERESSSGE